MRNYGSALIPLFFMIAAPLQAATGTPTPVPSPYSYADVADLAAPATMIAAARIRTLTPLPPESPAAAPAGLQRYYAEADVTALIRGPDVVAPRIAFLIDLAAGRDARRALLKKSVLLFGNAGTGPAQFQLLSSQSFLPWTPAVDAQVRGVATELARADAPPPIARVGDAFHVEGTVAGESETQIFLTTAKGEPVSLSIVRRPDIAPKFGVALGEIVDEAATLPPRDSLLWYRLACQLPANLPARSVAKLEGADADGARADYRAFMEGLGACPRTRPAPLGKGPQPG